MTSEHAVRPRVERRSSARPPSATGKPARRRVLIVDDDPHICALVEMTLSGAGYEVNEARNGREALDLLAMRRFDVIVLDYQMPLMNGVDFARAYRSRPGPHVPIVVTSAVYDITRFATETHAADVLPKPFSPRVLLDVVAEVAGG